jgi:hypothetical protein
MVMPGEKLCVQISSIFDFPSGANSDRNVVLLMYSQGGLDITNVYSYCKSVKFMWIKKQ